jgi:hypothetical protein
MVEPAGAEPQPLQLCGCNAITAPTHSLHPRGGRTAAVGHTGLHAQCDLMNQLKPVLVRYSAVCRCTRLRRRHGQGAEGAATAERGPHDSCMHERAHMSACVLICESCAAATLLGAEEMRYCPVGARGSGSAVLSSRGPRSGSAVPTRSGTLLTDCSRAHVGMMGAVYVYRALIVACCIF